MLSTAQARALVNQIIDPCSAARGIPIGLVDMGLLGDLRIATEAGGRWGVEATMRVTGPSCLMSLEFETRARDLLTEAGAAWVHIRWDSDFLWTEQDMLPAARNQLHARRRERSRSPAARAGG